MTVQAYRQVMLGAMVLAAATSPLSVEGVESGLRVAASLPRPTYDAGQVVEVSLTATNTGGAPGRGTFASRPPLDLRLRPPRGGAGWRGSHDKAFLQGMQTPTPQPRHSPTFQIP